MGFNSVFKGLRVPQISTPPSPFPSSSRIYSQRHWRVRGNWSACSIHHLSSIYTINADLPLTAVTWSNLNSACGSSNISPSTAAVLWSVSMDATPENQLYHTTALYTGPSWSGYEFWFVFSLDYSLAVTCCILPILRTSHEITTAHYICARQRLAGKNH